jgi:EAL domain-containing protein (putative c-di-GMP-specific phosphodiesterase class I)
MTAGRFLIIDDETDLVRFMADVAAGMGFAVASTVDAREVDRLLESFKPTLIVVDLQMKDFDGIEVLRRLAALKTDAAILMSSGMGRKVLQSAYELGVELHLKMVGIIAKPIRAADLRALLELHASTDRRLTPADLESAMANKELVLHFQPKLQLSTGSLLGVEALVRWAHPVRGMIMPNEFISLAESNNLIDRLTEYVFSEAVTQTARWRGAGLPLTISVNLSAKNLNRLDMPDLAEKFCKQLSVPTSAVTFELTESAAMQDAARTMDVLTRLRLKGFHLSMDDFGTGYSSLVQLQRLPFSELKVDKSFVIAMEKSRDCAVIVKTIIGMAKNLELTAVAEGVETATALGELRSLGCDMAQGFFIGRGMAADKIPTSIRGFRAADGPAPAAAPREYSSAAS